MEVVWPPVTDAVKFLASVGDSAMRGCCGLRLISAARESIVSSGSRSEALRSRRHKPPRDLHLCYEKAHSECSFVGVLREANDQVTTGTSTTCGRRGRRHFRREQWKSQGPPSTCSVIFRQLQMLSIDFWLKYAYHIHARLRYADYPNPPSKCQRLGCKIHANCVACAWKPHSKTAAGYASIRTPRF